MVLLLLAAAAAFLIFLLAAARCFGLGFALAMILASLLCLVDVIWSAAAASKVDRSMRSDKMVVLRYSSAISALSDLNGAPYESWGSGSAGRF